MAEGRAHGRLPGTHSGLGRIARVLVIRLGPGEDVLPAMRQILEDADIRCGAILSGVASLRHASVRNIRTYPATWPIRSENRTTTTVPGPLEVLAMQGNVAPGEGGDLVIHCHVGFSVGAPPAVTYGGHLIEDTIVATTCELFIAEVADVDVRRAHDLTTRAAEFVISPAIERA